MLAGDELIVQSVSDVAEGVDGVRVQSVGGEMVDLSGFYRILEKMIKRGFRGTGLQKQIRKGVSLRKCKCGDVPCGNAVSYCRGCGESLEVS